MIYYNLQAGTLFVYIKNLVNCKKNPLKAILPHLVESRFKFHKVCGKNIKTVILQNH